MNRMVIDNETTKMSDVQCLECVISVMLLGHLADAEDEYVTETTLDHYDKEITVTYSRVNNMDVFLVTDEDLSYRLN